MASHSFKDIWIIGGHDVHPVLYYWILHIISLITNNSIVAYRVFSSLAIIILGLLGYTHIRKDFGEKTGLLFSFFMYFSPVSLIYANEIRMYAWGMLFVTILAIYAYRLAKEDKNRNWIIFGIASLFSIYIHYYGLMSAGIINIILMIYYIRNIVIDSKKGNRNSLYKKMLIKQIGIGILQGILYLPWFIYFSSQLNTMSKNGFWITVEFPKTYIDILGFWFSGNLSKYIGFGLIIPVYIYLIYLIKKNGMKESKPALYCIGVYVLVIIAALIVTLVLGTGILYYRYTIIATGLMFFAVSYMISKGKNRYIFIICIVVLVLGIYNNIKMIKNNYDSSNQKQIEFVKENLQEGDVFVYTNIGNGSVYAVNFPDNKQYFYNGANWGVGEAYKAFGPQMDTYITKDFLGDEECQGRIWVITSDDGACYKKYFDNDSYRLIIQKAFNTAYQDYKYQVFLVERVK